MALDTSLCENTGAKGQEIGQEIFGVSMVSYCEGMMEAFFCC